MSVNDYTFYNFYYLNYIRAVQYTQTTHRIVLMLVFSCGSNSGNGSVGK